MNNEQRNALLDVLEDPYAKVDENPYEFTDEVAPEDQPETVLPDRPLDVAGSFVDVLAELPDVNHNQRKIAYLIARKKSPQAIAAQCGVSAAYVKNLWQDPRIKRLVEVFRGGEIYQVIDRISAREMLDLAAVRAAEVLAEKMNAALSEEVQLRAALEVLKLTGHGAKEGDAPVQITIGSDVLQAYQAARREAGMEQVVEAEIVEEAG